VYKAGTDMSEHIIEVDGEGFLKNIDDWNKEVAIEIASKENIELSDAHWEIIKTVREFYKEFDLSPSMRALVKRTQQIYGAEKGCSIYLLQHFPSSPAKTISKIAGLPKPANCI
jgi:tRNA 2-thiouridine synthesizing protein E